MTLPANWIDKIFNRLIGIYGAQFKSKFSVVENGVDVGVANAKETWASELGGFREMPEAIAYALDHLPTEHAPNALEFRDICRRAPRKSEAVAAIEYKPTTQDIARHKEMAHKATEAVNRQEFDGLLWAKKPKSQKAMDFLFDAKKNHRRFPALAEIFDQHVANGIANEAGKILACWDGLRWINP